MGFDNAATRLAGIIGFMVRAWVLGVGGLVALVGCDNTDVHPANDARPSDARSDGTRLDSGANAGVACGDLATACPIPAQICCDLTSGQDTCIASSGVCAERRLECDGPEDCSATQECCLWSDRSECMDIGICGTTGSITEVMCHLDQDCDTGAGESCCGTAPGPVADVYGVCRIGACPQ